MFIINNLFNSIYGFQLFIGGMGSTLSLWTQVGTEIHYHDKHQFEICLFETPFNVYFLVPIFACKSDLPAYHCLKYAIQTLL